MRIKTVNDLQELISEEFAWRKKELSALRSNIATARSFAKNTSLRSGIALLYAHWEGFIKNVATYYLIYVSQKKIKYEELGLNFIALAFKQKLTECSQTQKTRTHIDALNFIFNKQLENSNLPHENIIKTQSNLNSEVFKEIMLTIGFDYSAYELNFKLIDEQLLAMRNKIAHGENLDVIDLDETKFAMIYEKIVNMMNMFETQVMNAACTGQYNRNIAN